MHRDLACTSVEARSKLKKKFDPFLSSAPVATYGTWIEIEHVEEKKLKRMRIKGLEIEHRLVPMNFSGPQAPSGSRLSWPPMRHASS